MTIPIENIYYLLSYAWNRLDEKEQVNVSIDDITDIKNLLAKVLINATKIQIKKGLDKSYINHTEDVPGIKGKFNISSTLKGNFLLKQRTICSFDEFSNNILTNQILVSTISTLIKTEGIDKDLKCALLDLNRKFQGVQSIRIVSHHFNKIKIHRNNKFYGFLMNVCELIHKCILPSENEGYFEFSDFTRDERKMNQLFEAFVRNFYKIEQNKFQTVKSENITWQLDSEHEFCEKYIPIMKTDITLISENAKIIIDAKYYRETMSSNFNSEKINSNNLYQLFSYLLNQEDGTERNNLTKGILLYPTVSRDYNLSYNYNTHNIEIKTVNLNQSWNEISDRLLHIIS